MNFLICSDPNKVNVHDGNEALRWFVMVWKPQVDKKGRKRDVCVGTRVEWQKKGKYWRDLQNHMIHAMLCKRKLVYRIANFKESWLRSCHILLHLWQCSMQTAHWWSVLHLLSLAHKYPLLLFFNLWNYLFLSWNS